MKPSQCVQDKFEQRTIEKESSGKNTEKRGDETLSQSSKTLYSLLATTHLIEHTDYIKGENLNSRKDRPL